MIHPHSISTAMKPQRASAWSPKTVPTYTLGRCSASARKHQGFGGSSAGEQNPPKHGRSIAGRVPIQSYAFLHGQGRACTPKRVTARRRGLLRRRMNFPLQERVNDKIPVFGWKFLNSPRRDRRSNTSSPITFSSFRSTR